MFEVDKPKSLRPPQEPSIWIHDGLILLDNKNHPVKDWPGSNRILSSEMGGSDSRVSVADCWEVRNRVRFCPACLSRPPQAASAPPNASDIQQNGSMFTQDSNGYGPRYYSNHTDPTHQVDFCPLVPRSPRIPSGTSLRHDGHVRVA